MYGSTLSMLCQHPFGQKCSLIYAGLFGFLAASIFIVWQKSDACGSIKRYKRDKQ